MQIPTYFSKAIPQATTPPAGTADSFGGQVAKSVDALGNVMMEIETEAEKKVLDASRFADFNQRRSMFSDRMGQLDVALAQDPDHKTYFDRAKAGIDAISADVLKDVDDPVTQQSILQHISPARDRYLLDSRHRQQALTVGNARASIDTSIDTSVNSAAARSDARDLIKDLGDIDATVAGGVAGGILGAEEGEKKRRAAHDTVYTTIAMQLADKEPGRFLENYKAGVYTGDVPAPHLEELRRYAENRSQAVDSLSASSAVWDALGPKGDLDPVNLDRMVAGLEKRFAAEPEKARVAIVSLKEKASAHEKGVQERRDYKLSGIWKQAMAGKSLASIIATPEFSSLDGKTQMTVKEHLEDRRWSMQRRVEEDPGRKAAQHEMYWRYSQPAILAGMTESGITALYPSLGVPLTDKLVEDRRKLDDPAKAAEAKIDQDDFNHFARTAGIQPEAKGNKAVLGEVKFQVENAIDAEQRARGGKPLSREEKAKIMRRGVVEVDVRVNQAFWGKTLQKKRVFDVQYPENIFIPGSARDQIEGDLAARGLPVTDSNIRTLYLRMKEK